MTMTYEVKDQYPASYFYAYIVVTVVNAIQFFVALVFTIALVSSKKVRNNAFNLYVLLIILPDTILVGEFTAFTFSKLLKGDTDEIPKVSWQIESIHDWVQIFYYVTNFYMNLIIAYEIYKMVTRAQAFKRYESPSVQKVLLQSGCVYFISGLYAMCYIVDAPWSFSHRGEDYKLSKVYGNDFFNGTAVTCIYFTVLLVPLIFLFYIFGYIWHRKLIDSIGNTRSLYLYFMRIIWVFLLFYIPGFLLNFLRDIFFDKKPSLKFWSGIFMDFLFPLQSLVTLKLASSKEDINAAVKDFLDFISCCFRDAFACNPINENISDNRNYDTNPMAKENTSIIPTADKKVDTNDNVQQQGSEITTTIADVNGTIPKSISIPEIGSDNSV